MPDDGVIEQRLNWLARLVLKQFPKIKSFKNKIKSKKINTSKDGLLGSGARIRAAIKPNEAFKVEPWSKELCTNEMIDLLFK